MPSSCCVNGCLTNTRKNRGQLKFHKFPQGKRGEDWKLAIRSTKTISQFTKICSRHFKPTDYVITSMGEWSYLSKTAVPSENLPHQLSEAHATTKQHSQNLMGMEEETLLAINALSATNTVSNDSAADVASNTDLVALNTTYAHSSPKDGVGSKDNEFKAAAEVADEGKVFSKEEAAYSSEGSSISEHYATSFEDYEPSSDSSVSSVDSSASSDEDHALSVEDTTSSAEDAVSNPVDTSSSNVNITGDNNMEHKSGFNKEPTEVAVTPDSALLELKSKDTNGSSMLVNVDANRESSPVDSADEITKLLQDETSGDAEDKRKMFVKEVSAADQPMEADMAEERNDIQIERNVNGVSANEPANRVLDKTGCCLFKRIFTQWQKNVTNVMKKDFDEQVDQVENYVQVLDNKLYEPSMVLKIVGDTCSKKSFIFQSNLELLRGNQNLRETYPEPSGVNGHVNNSIGEDSSENEGDNDIEIVAPLHASSNFNIPVSGRLIRPPLTVGSPVWAMKTNLLGVFIKGNVISIQDAQEDKDKIYKVRYGNSPNYCKVYRGKELAYTINSAVKIPVGTRIVAQYRDDAGRASIYAGIVAETPSSINRARYLIFFDDGFAQYTKHEDIFLMVNQTGNTNVVDDLHETIRDFIRRYLMKYPEKPLLKLQVNQKTHTEYNAKWYATEVLEVDASLVLMNFKELGRTEWIYRGSRRLRELQRELDTVEAHKAHGLHRRRVMVQRRVNAPYVEYTRESGTRHISIDSDDSDVERKPKKNTSRKSTTKSSSSSSRKERYYKKVGKFTQDIISHFGARNALPEITKTIFTMRPHAQCTAFCKTESNMMLNPMPNPMRLPLLNGFTRSDFFYRYKSNNIAIMYKAPCGRSLYNKKQVLDFLIKSKSLLTIDMFSFDTNIVLNTEFKPLNHFDTYPDLTSGRESVPITCVNAIDKTEPPKYNYSKERFPGPGVTINTDPDFRTGCSCVDECQDFERCECHQLTNYAASGNVSKHAGYQYKRLDQQSITAIYECNQSCKCSSQCGNRLVQYGIQVRLQMFKTQNKGWGIRCVDDLEKGAFVCVYAGEISTETLAEKDGISFGDEYLAELDHMDVVERHKENYEEKAPDIEAEDQEEENKKRKKTSNSDNESSNSSVESYVPREKRIRSCRVSEASEDSSSNQSTERVSTRAVKKTSRNVARKSTSGGPPPISPLEEDVDDKTSKIRSYFGDDGVYVINAKQKGNIGRYFNHSCDANIFVQNVFTDTHDLRFPQVAFFTFDFIPAGKELTWDYAYEVGSVNNKVLYCYCESSCCRGRLL